MYSSNLKSIENGKRIHIPKRGMFISWISAQFKAIIILGWIWWCFTRRKIKNIKIFSSSGVHGLLRMS